MPRQTHTGRPIDHPHLISLDLPASKRFYAAVFETLGRTRIHLAFQASSRATTRSSDAVAIPFDRL